MTSFSSVTVFLALSFLDIGVFSLHFLRDVFHYLARSVAVVLVDSCLYFDALFFYPLFF